MNEITTTERPSRAIDVFKAKLTLAAPTLQKMVPAHVSYDRFQAQLVTAVAYNPKLLECDENSLLRAAAECVSVGLSLSPTMKEADIVPVWSPNGTAAQFRPRYMGLMKLARQSGEIGSIYAHEVYERDEFVYEYGLEKKLIHKPASGDRGKIIAGYCVWVTKDLHREFEVIDERRINRAKDASEGYKAFKAGKIKSTPWATDEGEMVRKTAVHAASKYFPRSTESEMFLRALHNDEDHIIDSEATPVVDTPALAAPRTDAGAAQVKGLEEKIVTGGTFGAQNVQGGASGGTGTPEPHDWKKTYDSLAKQVTKQDRGSWNKWLEETAQLRENLAGADADLGAKLQQTVDAKTAAYA